MVDKWKGKKRNLELNDLVGFAEKDKNLHSFIVGHIIIEYLLVQLIDLKLEIPEKFDAFRLNFPEKIDLCIALGALKEPLANYLKKLNEIRNQFAHTIGHKLNYETCYNLIKEAGIVGIEFTDNLDHNEKLAKETYDKEEMIDVLFDNIAQELGWIICEYGGDYTMY